ncbi:LacI family DNA-binding transcriptional regulator [Micromonospora sp. STR1_7]|uniref:LacI family DNA-binding transcriptional regulator n=1 Tax=Micromonospora parastrephiae TaxID=2806101 RepID=A0ABS1XVQ6_9ACTN|nr:LacI family DNA-binding transcriptional regulator [Micromonospora parastrephiae]MBM0233357.1 LacI family DNA-binding transcriptional regulator [Micromonospora parastrephiae]
MTTAAHRPATLEDVARLAGVSRSTASRVIAGTGFASPDARDRVATAAHRLGYVPNPAARALVSGAGVRLVVAVAGTSAAVLDDPYVHRVVGSAARVCTPAGVGVALHWLPLGEPTGLDQLARDRSVCGVVLVNTTEDLLDAIPRSLRGRVVSIGIGSPTVPSFDVDNTAGADAVLHHLYATGRRRIAMVTGPQWLPCSRRPVEAYRGLMRQAGLPERVLPGDFSAARGRAAAGEALRRWPDVDAIYAISDETALGVIAALSDEGVRVPSDVAVAGFDDIPLAAMTAPALTTASHPVGRIATAAATALLDGRPAAPVTLFPSVLVARASA